MGCPSGYQEVHLFLIVEDMSLMSVRPEIDIEANVGLTSSDSHYSFVKHGRISWLWLFFVGIDRNDKSDMAEDDLA